MKNLLTNYKLIVYKISEIIEDRGKTNKHMHLTYYYTVHKEIHDQQNNVAND